MFTGYVAEQFSTDRELDAALPVTGWVMFLPCFSEGFGHGMDIELCGKPFWLHGIRGTVHGVCQWSEQSTYRPPIGSMAVGDTLFVDIPAEKTLFTREYQRFWVVAPDGRQFQVGLKCPVREGQEVCLVWGNLQGKKTGRILYVRNLSTGQSTLVSNTLPLSVVMTDASRMAGRLLKGVLGFALLFVCLMILTGLVSRLMPHGEASSLRMIALLAMVVNLGVLVGGIALLRVVLRLFRNRQQALRTLSTILNSNPRFLESL